MSDRFHPVSMEQLTHWVFTELEHKDSLFNIPRSAFFVPRPGHRFRLREYGVELDTPFGVAAGPHTQMAQNLVASWVVGARMLELKTIQTLDELEVNKPCIDVTDEGYNVEWSQELKVHQSFDEYLRAWVLIHALHRRFGWPGDTPGMIFNMSVGYNLEGMLKPNVQWYFDAMADASAYLPAYVDIVAQYEPAVREIRVPARLSDSITLSTMHGCPPDEIERISEYLLVEKGLHTSVKCNPTLLGPGDVRQIINDDLGYTDVPIPDAAFGHDLKYADAVPMFHRLRRVAAERGLLVRPQALEHARGGELADGLRERRHDVPVRPGAARGDGQPGRQADRRVRGRAPVLVRRRGRLLQRRAAPGLRDAHDHRRIRPAQERRLPAAAAVHGEGRRGVRRRRRDGHRRLHRALRRSAAAATRRRPAASPAAAGGNPATVTAAARFNLRTYADAVRHDWRYRKASFRMDRSKTARTLGAFDCIEPPCVDTCPVDQAVPLYMDAVRRGDLAEAIRITRQDNPLPSILGRVCDHLCETTCIRTHLDQPVAIRQIKRFIMDQEGDRDGADRRRPRRAPGWPSSGRGRRASRPRARSRGPASASPSSRPSRMPAAWSAGQSRRTGCPRPRSTRTSRCCS